jgi:phospho-N-acetylmuramoyl-pentapeptide-transferase
MGGLAFLISVSSALLISAALMFKSGNDSAAESLLLILLFSLMNALIGVIDDIAKLKKQKNKGLSPLQKIIGQLASAVVFLVLRAQLFGNTTSVEFSFGRLELGVFYYPLAVLLLLGIVNCANLTDGIDGLASSVAFTVGVSIFYFSAFSYPEAAVSSVMLVGASLGFLFFNINPAKIFMGDTGSLFLGGIVCALAFALDMPLILILIGFIYIVETLSVILQVAYFKLTGGKRLFKMAPIHHHFEMCGWKEEKIVLVFSGITALLCILAWFGVSGMA